MDDVFGEIMGSGYGSDSTMLRLLRSAMDEAHENVQSKDGPIELLNARSKFYEMAMILVEGCSSLIQEKAQIPEDNREKMLSDLKESKDMVRGRLQDLKFSIVDRDIELVERNENELRVRQILESQEKELVSLRAKLALERTKSEELSTYQGSGDGEKDGDFCDLKNSVDQQMLSIKQKLEDERMSLSSANDLFGDENFEESSRPEQNLVIEQMSCDIDCLKGTLDLAFGRMQNIELGPSEKQLRWKIEKDTIFIVIGGFMSHLQEISEVNPDQISANELPFCLSSEQWENFISDVTSLHHELGAFINDTNEGQENGVSSKKICRVSSEPLPEPDNDDKPNIDQDTENSTHVAKMKNYHESIIRKQHEDLNWMKIRDIFRGKEVSFGKKNKDYDNLGGKIEEVVLKLDDLIKWNDNVRDKKCFLEKRKLVKKEKFGSEIRTLKQEKDDLIMQTILIEETFVTLLKGLIEDFYSEFHSFELQSVIKDDIGICIFREMMNELKLSLENKCLDVTIESTLKEDVYMVIFRNVIKEFQMEINCCNFENSIREDIYSFVVLQAMRSRTNFLMENEAHDQFPSNESVHEEEDLIHETVILEKVYENKEDSALNNYFSLRNRDGDQLHFHIKSSMSIPLTDFKTMVGDFELLVHKKLEANFLRLKDLTRTTENLSPTIVSLRREVILYKKAFEIRCHNLKLAEIEVDLLGDQVEDLVDLLESISLILNQNSTILSTHAQLSDIRSLIKKKLGGLENKKIKHVTFI